MKKGNWVVAAIMILGLAVSVTAKEGETFNVGGDAALELSNIAGDVEVKAGASGSIEINYTIKDDRIEVLMSQDGDTVNVEVKYPENVRNVKGGVNFEIRFPAEGNLNLRTVSGNISAEGISGSLELETVSGDVTVTHCSQRMKLKTVSGDVIMDGLGASNVDAATMSGDVVYKNGDLLDGPYEFATTSGKIKVSHGSNASYRVMGNTVSGSVNTNIGSLTVKKAKYGPNTSVRGDFGSGDVSLDLSVVSGSISIQEQ